MAGVPMLEVRDFLKRTMQDVGLEYLSDFIADEYDYPTFIDELRSRGWIEDGAQGTIKNTLEGNAVAQAKKLKPIPRAKAVQLLNNVLEAVDEINGNDLYAYDVSKLAVFGSYLSESEDLGDLDIAFELKGRWTPENADEVRQRSIAAFPPPKSADFMRLLGWPEEVVMKKMAVSNRVSFERLSSVIALGFPYRMLRE